MPETDTSPPDGSYSASFGSMAADAARASKAYADVTREKVAAEGRTEREMIGRGEEDRARSVQALKNEGIKPEEFKPWNAEAEHRKFESDPLQGFGSTGAVFAMIASAFTKAPMLSAIEGMTGALGAIKEGNEAAYNRAFDSWKENIKVAKQRHEIEHQAYTDSLALSTHDLALSQARLRAEAARFGDKQILALAENGMIKEIYDTIQARTRAVDSAAQLAENTTIRTMQKRALEGGFAEIDKQQGPPGPDGQPTQVPDAIKAAQKLRLMNTVMASGKMGTPQQTALAQLMLENPTMPVDELLKKAEQYNIIRQPITRGGGAKAAEEQVVMERAREISKEQNIPMTQAIGQARTEAKADSKTGAAMRERIIAERAKALQEDDPSLTPSEANSRARREITIESSAPSPNRIDDLRRTYDQADNAIRKSEKILKFLEEYTGGAGIAGKIMRGEEIAENITGISTRSDRAQMRRDVAELQEIVPRILVEQNGRPLASAAHNMQIVVAGLNAGDTGPNTRRAFRELIEELKKRKADISGRITGGFDPEKRSSGATGDEPATDVSGKKAPSANWLDAYPKKP